MKRIALCIISLSMLSAVGCVKKQASDAPEKEVERVVDMSVPAGFDWATTRDVQCNVTTQEPVKVFVATAPGAEPFAAFHAGGGLAPVTLNIPAQYGTLYVRCQNPQDTPAPRVAAASNGGITFDGVDVRYDDTPMDEDVDGNIIYMPSRQNGWGTLMFEDLWPSYGDFDFNDVVFKYQIRHYLTDDNRVISTQFVVRVVALGGSRPYDLFLQMHAVKSSQIESVTELYPAKNAVGNAAVELYTPFDANKDRAFFRFREVRANQHRPAGYPFLNTIEGGEISDDELVEVAAEVRYKEPVKLENLEFSGLDFFIAQLDDAGQITREVHRFGYEPINYDGYFSLIDPEDARLNYYQSKDNLVWAVNVPMDIRHAYEKIDFLKAYPEFKAWAQSGGRQAQDWYEHGVDAYLVSK